MANKPCNYRKSGVNIDTAATFVKGLKPLVSKTNRPEVLSKIGHFAGLFSLAQAGLQRPVLVASTDGVGTKLKIAVQMKEFATLGQDLVAMSANDILCCGAEPLFFLDYFATGRLRLEQAIPLMKGIIRSCRDIHCALLGGETAEMPSVYQGDEFDLAGFIVGIVEQEKILDGSDIRVGDQIIGIASSGLHSNGFSLVRNIIRAKKISLNKIYAPLKLPLGMELLRPTRLYVNQVRALKKRFKLRGIAHITGGGLLENLNRILPAGCRAVIDRSLWPRPHLFRLLQEWGNVEEREMQRVFNCGIGLMLVVSGPQVDEILQGLKKQGDRAWRIGDIVPRRRGETDLEVL